MKTNSYAGKFIAIEGLDGAGKSLQAQMIFDFLKKNKKNVHLTKEPTSNLIGGLIRSQLSNDWKSSQECLQLLFAADRSYHLEKEINPLLKKDINVITVRYFFSSFAYGALDLDLKWLIEINSLFLLPDMTFLLKISAKTCLKRIMGNRYEVTLFEKEKILTKVKKNFEKLTKIFPNIYVINGEQPPEKVFEDIKKILVKKINY